MIFVEALFVFVFIAFIWMLVTLAMFKKLSRARITGVMLILLAFIAVGAVIFVVGHFLEWHETNEFCADMCHSMKEGPYESYTNPKNNTMMETHFEKNVTCAECHSGPGFIGLGKSFLPVPNEALHQYLLGYDPDDLGGHVPAENCMKGCHEEEGVDWKFESPMPKGEGYDEINGTWKTREIYHPFTKNGTTVEELKDLETCLECHDARDNSFGFTAEACHICHDIGNEELDAHGEATCSMATCHRDKDGNPVQPKLTGHNTVTDHCMECHSRDHPDNGFVPYSLTNSKGTTFTVNGTFCAVCHKETYDDLTLANPKHFQENDCTECHLEHKTRPDCLSCHDTDSEYPTDHSVASPFDDCESCHKEAGHNPKEVSFETQDSAVVSKDFCNACHQENVYDKFEDGKLHTQQSFTEDCLSCHDVHEADVQCTSCHIEGGIAPEPPHSQSGPFADCTSCHTDGHKPGDLNFTNFQDKFNLQLSDDFCVECHSDEKADLLNLGLGHATQDCTTCHASHDKEDVACLSCHNAQGPAPEPAHDVSSPYDNCLSCHESGHSPKVDVFRLSPLSRDFCADVSCHGGPYGAATVFEDYGANHRQVFDECKDCHSQHEVGRVCTDAGCHSNPLPSHDPAYVFEDCVDCHDSAHDPLKRAPRPGNSLTQRGYMSNYFVLSKTDMTNSFSWVKRGNHDVYTDCTECHLNSEVRIYPATAQGLMNVSGMNCAGSCHDWIDSVNSGTPILLVNDSTNSFSKHYELFNSPSNGGCTGFCHQSDPSNPVFDGTGHGTVTGCLDSNCHGGGFTLSGEYHKAHQDMLSYVNPALECYTVCHKGPGDYGAPVDGGCYDCHKSGHDPRILATSPCYSCHSTNLP